MLNERENIGITNELVSAEAIDDVAKFLNNTKGIVRKTGPFEAKIEDDYSVTIVADNGWCMIYPPMNDTWAVFVNLLSSWDESSKETFEAIIKCIIYPVSTRIVDIDKEYLEDIIKAHSELTKRVVTRGEPDSNN